MLKQGIPAKVNFDMNDSTACLSHVVFEQLGVDKDLTKQKITTIDIPKSCPIKNIRKTDKRHSKMLRISSVAGIHQMPADTQKQPHTSKLAVAVYYAPLSTYRSF